MYILIFIIGILLGYFISSIFFQFIIEDIIHEAIYGDNEYENRKNKN